MTDTLSTALLEADGLTATVVTVTQTARELSDRHQLFPTAAELLGQALAGAALLASLQKEDTRLNLQLECDGPLGGLFVDASSSGHLRGYVKNPMVDSKGNPGPYHWRAALGNSGFMSVLKDQGKGEHYRSSVSLEAFSIEQDLARYFVTSEQIASKLSLNVEGRGDQPLEVVAGALVQLLPNGKADVLEKIGKDLDARLKTVLTGSAPEEFAARLLGPDAKPLAHRALMLKCSCSREKVLATLAALGHDDLLALHKEQGRTSVTCQLCGERHEVSGEELLALAGPKN